MKERKRHISFGLPGRLSINGFGGEDSGIGSGRLAAILLSFSALSLPAVAAFLRYSPDIAPQILAWPTWIWPAFGITLALPAIVRRTRLPATIVVLLWIGFAVFFTQAHRAGANNDQTGGKNLAAAEEK